MRPRRCTALAFLALVGCGRIAFDSSKDGSVAIDTGIMDDAGADSGMASDLLFHVKFEGDGADVAGGRIPTCPGCALSFTARRDGAGDSAVRGRVFRVRG